MRPGWVRGRLTIGALLFLVLFLTGCGGSSTTPTGPTGTTATPTPTPLGPSAGATHFDVVDGVTGATVTAGQFTAGADPAKTFGRGFDAGPVGGPVVVTSSGYLRRETVLPADGRLTLWPATDATEEEYVRRIVYINALDNATQVTLSRLAYGSYQVALAPEIDNAATRAVLDRVFARLRDVTHGAVNFAIGDTNPVVRVSVDASVSPFGAFTNWNSVGGYIQNGTVRLVAASRAQDEALLLHEFGHMIGLQHSSRTEDVMNSAARTLQFTPREQSVVTMMFIRNARTTFPDSDVGTTFRSATTTAQFGCGR